MLFDGASSPLLYVSSTQVGAIVPYAVSGQPTTILEVVNNGHLSDPIVLPVAQADPGIFTVNASGRGHGAILNQDGTANSSANAASNGSTISIYAHGHGQTTPAGIDGVVVAGTLPKPILGVEVYIDGKKAAVSYSGAAPGLISGVLQVNAQVPLDAAKGDVPLVLKIDTVSAPAVILSIR